MTVSSCWIWLRDLARQLVMAPGRDRVQDGVEAALASGTVSGGPGRQPRPRRAVSLAPLFRGGQPAHRQTRRTARG